MVSYAKAPLPRWLGREETGLPAVVNDIGAWASSTAMRDLVDCFEEKWPAGGTSELLAGLEEISARHWDFRAGGERANLIVKQFKADVTERVHAAATALRLRGENEPSELSYDHILIHGGLLRGCLIRARYAGDLLKETIEAPDVCGLGSFRPTTKDEAELALELGVGSCPDEFSAMEVALRAAFNLVEPTQVRGNVVPGQPCVSFLIKQYQDTAGVRVGVVAAPTTDPIRRANTADTCTFWADHLAHPRPGQRILLVTTEVFVPFQHCDAIRVLGLPYGCAVETIGLDPTAVTDNRLRQELGIANYLQEVRSAIRSMRALFSTVHTG
ncbi:hypothetical protein [Micromonospora sp. NPDC006431]|uniref:hypothetical protein n=1 Tax=Micromonospora sp. NPDC006431 TaxID=3364235 RepID=UPI0036D12161